MMEYFNPNDHWSRKMLDDMNDQDRLVAAILQCASFILMLLVALALCALLGSCTTTKYVPVTEQHTEHHWHTDSVKERDSVHTENTTIIREVDSAVMAKYGIQMQNNQRAWLVLQREMEQRLRELEHMTATRDTTHDSIPVPYPVIHEVEKKLTTIQQGLMAIGSISIMAVVVLIGWRLKRLLP